MDPKMRSAGSSSTNVLQDDAASCSASASANNNTAPSAPVGAPVTATSVLEGLRAHKEWVKAIVFDHDGRLIAGTVKPLEGESLALVKLFDKREDTIASGIILLNEQYDVHRFHPPLLYGRRGDPLVEDTEGIAVCRVERKSTKTWLYCLITYTYPTLSARAVPDLKIFCDTTLANLG